MEQADVVHTYELCKDQAKELGLFVGVLGTNFVVQKIKSGTILYVNASIAGVHGFIAGVKFAQEAK